MQRFDHSALRDFRRQAGLTREQLAAATARSYQSIVCYEQGQVKPRVDGLERIADVLGIKPGDLFSDDA